MRRNIKYPENYLSHLLLLFLWPFIGWIYSLYSSHSKKIKLFTTAYFSAVLGYNVICNNVTADSASYAKFFRDSIRYGYDFGSQFISGKFDIFAPISYVVIGRFTSDPHILFAIWTCIFGILLYKSISLLSNFTGNIVRYSILMVLLYFVCSHYTVVTARFFIGFWYFVCMFSHYIYYRKNLYFVLLMLTPLIHNAFLSILPLIFIERFVKVHVNILLAIMIACVLIGEFSSISEMLNQVSAIQENEHYSTYVEAENIKEYQEISGRKSTLHLILNNLARMSALVIILYAKSFYNNIVDSRLSLFYNRFYVFTILLYSFSSLVYNVTSLGRFMHLSYYFAIAVALLCLTQVKLRNSMKYIVLILFSFSGVIYIACLNLISIFTLNGYYPIIYFMNEDF